MDSLETLETLVAQIKRGNESQDSNLVINSLESISLLADQMIKTATQNEKDTTVESVVKEDDVLESVGDVEAHKEEPLAFQAQKIDASLLNGFAISNQPKTQTKSVQRLNKEELELLRQEILMQKNTVNFRSLMEKEREEWKKLVNRSQLAEMPMMVNESNPIDFKDVIIEKTVLKGTGLNPKTANKKVSFIRKTKDDVAKFKEKLGKKIEEIKRRVMAPEIDDSVFFETSSQYVKAK